MKTVILVTNPDKVDLLDSLGFSSCGVRDVGNGILAYQYIKSDALHKVLKDKSLFSRKDFCEDVRLTF